MTGFSLESPWALFLLPAAPLLAWWLLRRRRPALRYSDVSPLVSVPSAGGRIPKWGGVLLRGLTVLLLVLAVANPRLPDLKTPVPVDGIALTLVVDVSGSMGEQDFGPEPKVTRLDAAKRTFRLFVEGGTAADGTTFPGRTNDQIGIVTFAAVPETACPLTLNRSVALKVMDELTPRTGLDAGTNIGDALGLGLAGFDAMTKAEEETNKPKRKKVLVLLSDGEHNKEGGEVLRPLVAAQMAAKLDIPIYTIDCGISPDDPNLKADVRRQREDGRAVLEEVAKLSHARAFAANNPDELRAAFAEIDRLEKVAVVGTRYRRYWSFALPLALLAAGCVLLLAVLDRTVWRRLP